MSPFRLGQLVPRLRGSALFALANVGTFAAQSRSQSEGHLSVDSDPIAAPLADAHDLEIEVFENAVVSPDFNAAYDDRGNIIPATALVRGIDGHRVNAPDRVDTKEFGQTPQIAEAYFGGVFFDRHYGHFLTETLSRLWPAILGHDDYVTGLPWLFRPSGTKRRRGTGDPVAPTFLPLLKASGLNDLIQFAVEPLRCRRLLVPRPANVNGRTCHHKFGATTRAIGGQYVESVGVELDVRAQRLVYLSRRKLPMNLRHIVFEAELERQLRRLDFEIVYPERCSIAEQISCFAESRVVAGSVGSAFHTSVLSPRANTRHVYLSDSGPPRTYSLIDISAGIKSSYINCLSSALTFGGASLHMVMDVDAALEGIGNILKEEYETEA